MKAIIENKHPETGYVVTFENGKKVECKTVDEAIKIKNGAKDETKK